ncbi:MAG: site-specific integrase, partial [Chloroflexi bacterium]|nr:site-specific integrase [Chloroflexota bacterium]
MLVDLALKTGLRRGELANLDVKDIQSDFLIVRKGKNQKDRVVPLTIPVARKLHNYIKNKKPDEKVFGLKDSTITMKIKKFATVAGTDLHGHSLRHKFATNLRERGV